MDVFKMIINFSFNGFDSTKLSCAFDDQKEIGRRGVRIRYMYPFRLEGRFFREVWAYGWLYKQEGLL